MTNDKVNEVLADIYSLLAGYNPRRLEGEEADGPSRGDALRHCRAIAQLAIEMPAEKLEKKFRWLGFIQGVLWTTGMQSLDELKRANMPNEEVAK